MDAEKKKEFESGDKIMPYDYEFINVYNSSIHPSTVHCRNTALVNYHARYLFKKILSVFEFKGLPEEWADNYFKYILFGYGYIAVFDTERYGVIPQECGLTGFNVFYQPTEAIIANPLLPNFQRLSIGSECELIKIQPDYHGVIDIVATYADLLSLSLETAGINLLNSKTSYVFFAEDKATAETYKKMYDKLASGEPMAVISKNLKTETGDPNWDIWTQNVGQNYITDRLLNDYKSIQDQFNTLIGIPNANTQKRERLISSEVEANDIDTQALALLWLENMRKGVDKVNKRFGLNISVDYRFRDYYEGEGEENGNNVNSGPVSMG